MFGNLLKQFRKNKQKKIFSEYGYKIDSFSLQKFPEVEFAQWQHPFCEPFQLRDSSVDFYRTLVKPGDFIIDIGAHLGDTTVPMALAAGKEGCVLALEPNRYVFKILEKNASLNAGLTNIIPLNIAATAADGQFSFNYSDASFCNGGFLSQREKLDQHHKYTLQVEGRNLEKILENEYAHLLPRLSLIKVDAEGYDKEIIKTLSQTIRSYRPKILSECNQFLTRAERDELYDVMTMFHYRLFKIEEDDTTAFTSVNDQPLLKEDMMKHKHFDVLALPENQSVMR
jgi:FkbM family methyltransferase